MEDKRTIGVDEVIITKDEYTELIQTQKDFDLLEGVLVARASLSWNKSHLEFNGEDISLVLSVIDAWRYSEKLRKMKEEIDGTVDND